MANNVWTGTGFNDKVIDEIRDAEDRIIISSPWISKKYAQLLIDKSKEGVNVNIVTSDDTENKYHKESLEVLTEQRRIEEDTSKNLQNIALTLGLFSLISASLNHYILGQTVIGYVIAALLMVLAAGSFYYRQTRKFTWEATVNNLTVIEHNPFEKLHSKVFIVDETAYVGSLNLTHTAVNRNFETVVQIKDEEHINNLEEDLNNIELPKIRIPEIAERSRTRDTQEVKNKLSAKELLGLS